MSVICGEVRTGSNDIRWICVRAPHPGGRSASMRDTYGRFERAVYARSEQHWFVRLRDRL